MKEEPLHTAQVPEDLHTLISEKAETYAKDTSAEDDGLYWAEQGFITGAVWMRESLKASIQRTKAQIEANVAKLK